MTFLGYCRVSRVGDRADTLISDKDQAKRITSYAQGKELEVEMLDPELDVSGGKIERPILSEAIRQIEEGEAEGIIVAQLDRLSRMDLVDAIVTIKRIEDAGGQVKAVKENYDSSSQTDEGVFIRNIYLSVADMQLRRYKAQFASAKEQAVKRGIWPISKVPLGYRIGDDRKLEVDAAKAALVVKAFEARASGGPWSKVADILGRGMTGAIKIIRNRVYLGEIRLGDLVNPNAHDPIVTEELWEAAQIEHPRPGRGRNGPALLAGLVTCASCGYKMTPDARNGWRGYRCRPRKASGICPEPAMISARIIDPYVEETVISHAANLQYKLSAKTDALKDAETRLKLAEAELGAFQEVERASEVEAKYFEEGMNSRVLEVKEAQRELSSARKSLGPSEIGMIVEKWPELDVGDRRHLLGGALGAVLVSRGRGRPASHRVTIIDADLTTEIWPIPEDDFSKSSS
jgi:site-specific DNA recombinase